MDEKEQERMLLKCVYQNPGTYVDVYIILTPLFQGGAEEFVFLLLAYSPLTQMLIIQGSQVQNHHGKGYGWDSEIKGIRGCFHTSLYGDIHVQLQGRGGKSASWTLVGQGEHASWIA